MPVNPKISVTPIPIKMITLAIERLFTSSWTKVTMMPFLGALASLSLYRPNADVIRPPSDRVSCPRKSQPRFRSAPFALVNSVRPKRSFARLSNSAAWIARRGIRRWLLDRAFEFVRAVRLNQADFRRECHLMPVVEKQRHLRDDALVFHLLEFRSDFVRVVHRAGRLHRLHEHTDVVVVEQRDGRLYALRRA